MFKMIANFDLIIKKSDFKGLRPRGNIEQLYSETVFTAPGENTSRGETKTEREITSKPPPVYGLNYDFGKSSNLPSGKFPRDNKKIIELRE